MKFAVAEPPRDIFDVRIEAAVFVNDQDRRNLSHRPRGRAQDSP